MNKLIRHAIRYYGHDPNPMELLAFRLLPTQISEMTTKDGTKVVISEYNKNHDTKGRFAPGAGGGSGSGSSSRPMLGDNPSVDDVNNVANSLSGKTNLEIFEQMGYNGLPKISDKEPKNPIYRYETGATPKQFKKDLMYGKKRYLPEVAVMGSGTYFSPGKDTLYGFGGGLLVTAGISKTAKVKSIGDTHILRQKLLGDSKLSAKAAKLISDYGVLAALQGYDVIENPTTIVVMNRTKLIIKNDLKTDVGEMKAKTLKVEEPYDRMETKELELSTIHRYYMGSKLVAEIVIIYTDRSKKKIKSQERRI